MKQILLMIGMVALVGCGVSKKEKAAKEKARVEAAIRNSLKKPTGELTKAELEKVTILNLNWTSNWDARTGWGDGPEKLTQLGELSRLVELEELKLAGNEISLLPILTPFSKLTTLDLSNNKIIYLGPLSELQSLETLYLGNYLGKTIREGNRASNLEPLAKLKNLKNLRLTGNQVSDIKQLASLRQLKSLSLGDNEISDLSALEGLGQLESLELFSNRISDLSPLTKLTSLKRLELDNFNYLPNKNNINDLKPLAELTSLEYLNVSGNPNLTRTDLAELRKALPKCEIEYTYRKPSPPRDDSRSYLVYLAIAGLIAGLIYLTLRKTFGPRSHCIERVHALGKYGFYMFLFCFCFSIAIRNIGTSTYPPAFTEEEAEIVGVYQSPWGSTKYTYASDGTLKSDDKLGFIRFWDSKGHGQSKWTVNKEGYIEYYTKDPDNGNWMIDHDAPTMKILPNGNILQGMGEYTWKRIERPHPIIRALNKVFIPQVSKGDQERGVFSLVGNSGFNGWAALSLSLVVLVLFFETLIDLGKIKRYDFGWFDRIKGRQLHENPLVWLVVIILFALYGPWDSHWISSPFFVVLVGPQIIGGIMVFGLLLNIFLDRAGVGCTSLGRILIVVFSVFLGWVVGLLWAFYYISAAFVIREAILFACRREPVGKAPEDEQDRLEAE